MLAIAKLGAVIMPTTPALGPADLVDRITRGGAKFVIANDAPASWSVPPPTAGTCIPTPTPSPR
jgi:acyl-coenzyme A synthetase/AMP-(fatty) acid ligase